MKIWKLAFAMFAAFSLASCISDDDVMKRLLMKLNERLPATIVLPGVLYL